MDTGPAISVRGLTKRFGGQVAVDDLSFDVPAGRVVGFLGPNGAGKSTAMRMMIGLTAPTSGIATICGVPFHDLDDPARTVGSIVDGVGFHPGRRAVDELRIAARTSRIPSSRCDDVLELVGLADAGRKRVGQYSLGMRQRLGIAHALLGEPRVLLLDEPANGLDPEGIHWIRSLLRSLADDGCAVLVSSHLLGEIARLADDVVVIRRGKLITQASVGELTDSAGALRVASQDDSTLADALRACGADVSPTSDGLSVRGVSADEVGQASLATGIALRHLEPVVTELEDVFMELTAGGGIA